MAKRYVFTVAGSTRFPLDMLRYDACRPDRGDDVGAIDESLTNHDPRKCLEIRLIGYVTEPTVARWRSFGWVVTEQREER